MQGDIYKDIQFIKINEKEKLKIGNNEIIIKVKYVGICGTVLHM